MGWVSVKKWKQLPQKGGVYAIYSKGLLIYIGSSSNMQRRFETIGSNSRYIDITFLCGVETLTYKYKVTEHFRQIETSLIHKLQPKFNIQGTKKLPKRRVFNANRKKFDHSRNWYF